MKVFIWEGNGVLTDYTDGLIVVVAEDLESALKAIAEGDNEYTEGRFPALPSRVVEVVEGMKPVLALVWGGG